MSESAINGIFALVGVIIGSLLPMLVAELSDWLRRRHSK